MSVGAAITLDDLDAAPHVRDETALTRQTRRDTHRMHRTTDELEALIPHITAVPSDHGMIEMIVRRPASEERETVDTAELDTRVGLVGDNWATKGSPRTADGLSNPDAQLTLMNSRVTDAVAVTKDRWSLAGDQIYVDMDLSIANLPAGSRLSLGSAVIEISKTPHTGCAKFSTRFGAGALRFVSVGTGKELRFRGVNTRVVKNGTVEVGDTLQKL